MVFSNSPPDFKELAKVRFRVFNINNNQLEKTNIVEIKYPKEQEENVDSDSDVDSETYNLWYNYIANFEMNKSYLLYC